MYPRQCMIISTDEYLVDIAHLVPIIEFAGLELAVVISYAWEAWKEDKLNSYWWLHHPWGAPEVLSAMIYEDLDALGMFVNPYIDSAEVVQVALSIGVKLYYHFETDLPAILGGVDVSRLELEEVYYNDMYITYL